MGCRPLPSPGASGGAAILAAGWAWTGANFWRALWGRVEEVANGGQLELGAAEMCFVVCGTVIAIIGLAWSLRLATRLNAPTIVDQIAPIVTTWSHRLRQSRRTDRESLFAPSRISTIAPTGVSLLAPR